MLYICATPIGNLRDISLRAIEILSVSDVILCEDTRSSRKLLTAHAIAHKRLVALHEHNESEVSAKVLAWLAHGLVLTQITDAGTPGISDPGGRLCNLVLANGYKVIPIPGACAYTCLLSISGWAKPSLFYGFLPANREHRKSVLMTWVNTEYAVCIYESVHRIINCIEDIITILGENRELLLGRELTKKFETIQKMTAKELLIFLCSDTAQQKGEFVLLIYPRHESSKNTSLTLNQEKLLKLLINELPPKKAVAIVHDFSGADKDILYKYTISHKHNFT